MISESFKQDLLSRIDIVELIDTRVPLKKAGANMSACCPFHSEKTPSFTVSPSKQFYHCFGCGAHGNAITFLMEYGGLGYIEALRELADQCGMKLPEMDRTQNAGTASDGPRISDLTELMARAMTWYREQLKRSPKAIEYLKRRGLDGKTAARFGVGYAPEGWQSLQGAFTHYDDPALVECGLVIVNDESRRYDRFRDRIMFPILNARSQVIGFGGRVIDGGEPKYLNSPETPLFEKGRELYGLPQAREALRSQDRIFVVEGYMDVVALAQHGVANVVATLGTATTPIHLTKLLRQVNEIVFCFDGDRAGRKAAWHALEISLAAVPDGKMIRFLFLPPEDDPDTYVRAHGAAGFNEAAAKSMPLSRYLASSLAERHGADSAEGRSALLAEARPLVQSMKAPLLQMQLLRELAALGQMGAEELALAYGLSAPRGAGRPVALRAAEGAAPRGNFAGKPNYSAKSNYPNKSDYPGKPGAGWSRRNDSAAQWRSGTAQRFADQTRPANDRRLERQMLRALLSAPELAADVPVELISEQSPEGLALHALIQFLNDLPQAGSAAIAEHFRDSTHESLLNRAQADLMGLDLGKDGVRAELEGAIFQMRLKAVDAELKAIYALSSLSDEERERERALRTLAAELRTALRNSGGADERGPDGV